MQQVNYKSFFNIDVYGEACDVMPSHIFPMYVNKTETELHCKCPKCNNVDINKMTAFLSEYYSDIELGIRARAMSCECGAVGLVSTAFREYAVSRKVFVDNNKVKICIISHNWKFYNGRFVSVKKYYKVICNMETGRTFLFTKSANKKSLIDITYCKEKLYQLEMDQYNPFAEIASLYECINEAIKEIIVYNMTKYNLPEKAFSHIINNIPHSGASLYEILLITNKFPLIVNGKRLYDYISKKEGFAGITRKKINSLKKECNFFSDDIFLKSVVKNSSKKMKTYWLDNRTNAFEFVLYLSNALEDINNVYKVADAVFEYIIESANKRRYYDYDYEFYDCCDSNYCDNIELSMLEIDTIVFYIKYYMKKGIKENAISNRICSKYRSAEFRDTMYLLKQCVAISAAYDMSWNIGNKAHDILTKDYGILKKDNYSFGYQNHECFNMSINEYVFKVAESTIVLSDIGSKMNICVGAYGANVIENTCDIVSVKLNGEYVACIELVENFNAIIQVKGKSNENVESDPDLYEAIHFYCKKLNLLIWTNDISFSAGEICIDRGISKCPTIIKKELLFA